MCKKYVCSSCHEKIVDAADPEPERNLIGALGNTTKENEEMKYLDEVEMHQPAGELSEAVVEDLER